MSLTLKLLQIFRIELGFQIKKAFCVFYPSVRSIDYQHIFIECLQCIEQSAKSGYKKLMSIQENPILYEHFAW